MRCTTATDTPRGHRHDRSRPRSERLRRTALGRRTPQESQVRTGGHEYALPNVYASPWPTAHPSPDAYPAETAVLLMDGRCVALRRIGSADRDGLAALFARLSPESRRRRFFGPKTELTAVELAFLTDIDHVRHEAIAAIEQRDGSIVGVGRYVRHADRAAAAELAVEVADELQSQGLGTALASRTVRCARASGHSLLTATTLPDNRPARAVLQRLGFRARASHGSAIEYDLELI